MRRLSAIIFIAGLFFSSLLLLILIRRTQQIHKHIFSVVCTTSMLADAVKNISGGSIQVRGLMGPGVDPHLYRASAGDVNKLAQADIIFYNGLHLEGKMADLLESLQQAIAVADAIDQQHLLQADFAGVYDPHIWHDVSLWKQIVVFISDVLIEHNPDHKDVYQANTLRYVQQLQQLHEYVSKRIQEIPQEQRILVTAHDAFRYFGRAYGVQVVGLQGISTETDIGIKDMQRLADFIVEKKIPAIFVESSVAKRTIQAVQQAVISRGARVIIGPYLLSDALGDEHDNNATYIDMMRYNVEVIANPNE